MFDRIEWVIMSGTIIAFGAYDTRKPRVRLMIEAIRRAGALADEIHIKGWEKVAQTNVPSRWSVLKILLRMLLAYPGALWRLMRSQKGAAILLPYPGIVEILAIAPLARITRRKVILDAFLPLYDTIVMDRGFVRPGGLVAGAIHLFEKIALKRADIIIVDTDAHGDYFAREFGIPAERFQTVLVGAEAGFNPAAASDRATDLLPVVEGKAVVLFYGQLIPLHGVPTILAAAELYAGPPARWVVIGRGQLEPLMRDAVNAGSAVEWIEWIDYQRLPAVIARADLCLGVFGASDKAARVIPNKLFQQLAMGKPVITRASPAVDALAARFPDTVRTVAADDPKALAEIVAAALSDTKALMPLPAASLAQLSPDAGVRELLARLDPAC